MKNKTIVIALIVLILSITFVVATYFFISPAQNPNVSSFTQSPSEAVEEQPVQVSNELSIKSDSSTAENPAIDEVCAQAKKIFENRLEVAFSDDDFDALLMENIAQNTTQEDFTKFESCVFINVKDLGPVEGTAFGIKHLGTQRFERLTELALEQSRKNVGVAAKRANLGSLSTSIWLCLDQGGWNPPENNQLVCEGQRSTWPDLSPYGDTWGGCAFDVRENMEETGYYVQYCMTAADGSVQRCTEQGCEML